MKYYFKALLFLITVNFGYSATITSNYGEGVAQRIGNTHEGIPIVAFKR